MRRAMHSSAASELVLPVVRNPIRCLGFRRARRVQGAAGVKNSGRPSDLAHRQRPLDQRRERCGDLGGGGRYTRTPSPLACCRTGRTSIRGMPRSGKLGEATLRPIEIEARGIGADILAQLFEPLAIDLELVGDRDQRHATAGERRDLGERAQCALDRPLDDRGARARPTRSAAPVPTGDGRARRPRCQSCAPARAPRRRSRAASRTADGSAPPRTA